MMIINLFHLLEINIISFFFPESFIRFRLIVNGHLAFFLFLFPQHLFLLPHLSVDVFGGSAHEIRKNTPEYPFTEEINSKNDD